MSGPPVPEAWTKLVGYHRDAEAQQEVFANPNATLEEVTDAEAKYRTACDRMVAEMTQLSKAKELGRITLMLAKRERW